METEFELQDIKFLTQEWAQLRSSCLKNVEYIINLNLNKGQQYSGNVTIHFDYSVLEKPYLLLDYSGKQIESIHINGKELENVQRLNVQTGIPVSYLKYNDRNSIKVFFNNEYNKDGSGLHSFIDPQDQKQYIYSQSFLFFANRIFPCFDQPDLKATFELSVNLNQEIDDWCVIANSILKNKENNSFVFEKTQILPTYLFGVVAGPFQEIKCENTYKNIPMSLYSTQHYNQFLKNQKEQIFEITQKSMEFYESFFGYDYPFSKYDQIFCPEFNWGAMENAAMVIYTDNYVFKEQVDESQILRFSNTLAHELSHHWFGDLITMKWWKDLWLNESFAEFISHFCLYQIKDNVKSVNLEDIWIQFNTRKNWAYTTDEKSTTHSIASVIENTQQADGILDGITYSKGASVLKQLMNIMGEQQFSNALKSHFNKYAFKNASLEDLLKTLQENLQKNTQNNNFSLDNWKNQWLTKPGPNLISLSQISKEQIVIQQVPYLKQHPYLRNHMVKIAYFSSNPQKYFVQENVLIKDQEFTTINLKDLNLDFDIQGILLNYQDEGYAKIHFDNNSLKYFCQNISKINDKLTRILIWSIIMGMVKDGIIKSEIFVQAFINQISSEQSSSIYSQQLQNVINIIQNFTPQQYQYQLNNQVYEFLYMNMVQMINNKNEQQQDILVLLKTYIVQVLNVSNDETSQNNWKQMINWGLNQNQEIKDTMPGKSLWNLASKINLYQSKNENLDIQEVQDVIQKATNNPQNVVTNQRLQDQIKAQVADKDQKQQILKEILDENNKTSPENLSYLMKGINQNSIDKEFYDEQFYANLITVFQQKTAKFSTVYFQNLFPQNSDYNATILKLQQILDQVKGQNNLAHLEKQIKEKQDYLNQLIKINDLY